MPACAARRTRSAGRSCEVDVDAGDASVEVVVRVTGPGEIVNSASVRSVPLDLNLADNAATARVNTPVPAPAAPLTPPCQGGTKTGTAAADRLVGTACPDRLRGRGGNDRLLGLAGADRIFGGAGNDRLVGGAGRDVLDAGGGADTIVAADGVRDVIRCGPGKDTVRTDGLDQFGPDCEIIASV
jgi:Ca2+-binding RTX toxin-like protein